MCEIYSKSFIKTSKHRSGVFFVNFEQVLHIVSMFQLLTLNKCQLGISNALKIYELF